MRTYPSPFMTVMLVFGICLVGVMPPIGILFLLAAFFIQRSHTKGVKGALYKRAVKARDAEHARAVRYFS